MQVKVMFVFENRTFTCITGTWYGSYAGKIDVFFLRIAILPGKTLGFATFYLKKRAWSPKVR